MKTIVSQLNRTRRGVPVSQTMRVDAVEGEDEIIVDVGSGGSRCSFVVAKSDAVGLARALLTEAGIMGARCRSRESGTAGGVIVGVSEAGVWVEREDEPYAGMVFNVSLADIDVVTLSQDKTDADPSLSLVCKHCGRPFSEHQHPSRDRFVEPAWCPRDKPPHRREFSPVGGWPGGAR